MDLSSDMSSLQLTPITSTSTSVIAPRLAPGLATSKHTPTTLKLYTQIAVFAARGAMLCVSAAYAVMRCLSLG